jgi:hypothetical protein
MESRDAVDCTTEVGYPETLEIPEGAMKLTDIHLKSWVLEAIDYCNAHEDEVFSAAELLDKIGMSRTGQKFRVLRETAPCKKGPFRLGNTATYIQYVFGSKKILAKIPGELING